MVDRTADAAADPSHDWLEAELADTLEEDHGPEISAPALSMEIRRI